MGTKVAVGAEGKEGSKQMTSITYSAVSALSPGRETPARTERERAKSPGATSTPCRTNTFYVDLLAPAGGDN